MISTIPLRYTKSKRQVKDLVVLVFDKMLNFKSKDIFHVVQEEVHITFQQYGIA